MREAIGQHVLIDFWGCGRRADDARQIRAAMREAVGAMGATLLDLQVHRFFPHGLTAVAVLSESHLALHSWPEEDYVAIDVFTCGRTVRAEAGLAVLRRCLKPTKISRRRIQRGRGRVTTQKNLVDYDRDIVGQTFLSASTPPGSGGRQESLPHGSSHE